MGQIFEREFKREKNLEISRKLAGDAAVKDKKKADKEKLAQEKEVLLKERIETINEEFFKHVAESGEDVDKIKARGDRRMTDQEEAMGITKSGSMKAAKGPEIKVGSKYQFKCELGNFVFEVEAGNIINGSDIQGAIDGTKVIFKSNDKDFEGTFTDEKTC